MSTYQYAFGLEDEKVRNLVIDHMQPNGIGGRLSLRKVK